MVVEPRETGHFEFHKTIVDNTPPLCAVEIGRLGVHKIFVENSPPHCAAESGHFGVTFWDYSHLSPLHIAAFRGQSVLSELQITKKKSKWSSNGYFTTTENKTMRLKNQSHGRKKSKDIENK